MTMKRHLKVWNILQSVGINRVTSPVVKPLKLARAYGHAFRAISINKLSFIVSFRQLRLLLSLMKGKNRLTTVNFRWTNQLLLCDHVFELFDSLRPHVFTAHKVRMILYTYSLFIYFSKRVMFMETTPITNKAKVKI